MQYEMRAEIWLYPTGAWHFVTLPAEFTEGIRALTGPRRGWGSVRVKAQIGDTAWLTSIFPERSSGAFILPIKADVRRREGLAAGDTVSLTVEIQI